LTSGRRAAQSFPFLWRSAPGRSSSHFDPQDSRVNHRETRNSCKALKPKCLTSRRPLSIWTSRSPGAWEQTTWKGAAGPGRQRPPTDHPIREEHDRVRQTCFRTPVAFEGFFGSKMRRPLAPDFIFFTAEPERDPPSTVPVVARTMRPLYASTGKSPLGAAQSHRLRRCLQACRAHRRVSSPLAADG